LSPQFEQQPKQQAPQVPSLQPFMHPSVVWQALMQAAVEFFRQQVWILQQLACADSLGPSCIPLESDEMTMTAMAKAIFLNI